MTRRKLLVAVGVIVFSALLLPTAAYMVGAAVVGPYEGELGYFGYLGSILSDAWQGSGAAWLLLLAPMTVVGLWLAVVYYYRRPRRTGASTVNDTPSGD